MISDAVKSAINNGEPVVALESTIITHGMPYPHNVSTAKKVESIIQQQVLFITTTIANIFLLALIIYYI